MIAAVAAVSAQVTAGQYLLGRDLRFPLSTRVDTNAVANGGRHGYGVARLAVALILYPPDGRASVPFRSGVETFRQAVPKLLNV